MAALDLMTAKMKQIQEKIETKTASQAKALVQYQIQTFLLTYFLYIVFYLSRKPFSTLKTSLAEELLLTDADLGQIETIFLIMYAASQFMVGPFGDKYGARTLLLVALFGTAISNYMMSRASSSHDLMLAWGLNGVFQAAAFPLMMKALSPWFNSNDRAKMLGFWTTCQQVGGTVAVSLAGYLASGGISIPNASDDSSSPSTWRHAFVLPSILSAVAGVVAYVTMIEHPTDVGLKTPVASTGAPTKTSKTSSTSKSHKKPMSFVQVARLPYLFNVGLAYFCIKLVRYTMLQWTIMYLQQKHSYDVATAANMSTLFDIGGAFGAVACAMIAEHLFHGKRMYAVFVLCLCSGFATASYGLVADFGPFANMMMLFVTGFLIAGPDSVLGGAACSDVCERAGYDTSVLTTATGIANGYGSLGAILAGSGPVWVKNQFGWNGLFVGAGCLALVGALFLVPLVQEINKDDGGGGVGGARKTTKNKGSKKRSTSKKKKKKQ